MCVSVTQVSTGLPVLSEALGLINCSHKLFTHLVPFTGIADYLYHVCRFVHCCSCTIFLNSSSSHILHVTKLILSLHE